MVVTVTINAAMDRTLLVPNFQLGHRHRASMALSSAGGKGINVARALKRLGIPVVATGLAGGRTGTGIVEELTDEGILNDFVRIRDESRTSVAVLDPISNAYTEINEWGPQAGADEVQMLRDKLSYLTQGAEFVVFAGSLPRGVEAGFYADMIREASRREVHTALDTAAEPLHLGVQAGPYLVTPNMREAEGLVGHEFTDESDITAGLDEIAGRGARNVIITVEGGCYALLREHRKELRVRATAPHLDPVSVVGSGDTLLAGFIAAQVRGRSPEDALRAAVAAGAASVLEPGAGRVDVREVGRLSPLVAIEPLEEPARR